MAKHDELIDFVERLDIDAPIASFGERGAVRGAEVTDIVTEDTEQSFMADKSIISFASEVKGQNKEDVLNSNLLAQLAANKKYPDEKDIRNWYDAYVDVLSKIGWNVDSASRSTFESSTDIVDIQNVLINILTTAFGGNYIALLTKTLESIKSLSKSNGKISAFGRDKSSLSKGMFQIALAVEVDNTVALQMGTFMLTTSKTITNILFLKTSASETELEYYTRRCTLNTSIYATVRDVVFHKLGNQVRESVLEIDI